MDQFAFQQALFRHQFPANCTVARFLITTQSWDWGLFSAFSIKSRYLHHALVLDRIFLDRSTNKYFQGMCSANNFDCVFERLSNCSIDSSTIVCRDPSCWNDAKVVELSFRGDSLPCPVHMNPSRHCEGPDVKRSIESLTNLSRRHGIYFYQTELTRFLTRLLPGAREFYWSFRQQLRLFPQMISVHVRHGDKKEGIQHPTVAYIKVIRKLSLVYGLNTIFIGSDDNSAMTQISEAFPDFRVIFLPNSAFPNVHAARDISANPLLTNYTLQLISQVFMFASSEIYVGTRSSNIGVFVAEMQGFDCMRMSYFHDMDGDVYFNGWYGYSENEHVGSDMVCQYEQRDSLIPFLAPHQVKYQCGFKSFQPRC
jgi:hypothetical protein